MNYDYSEGYMMSVSAVGEALIALEQEIEKLEHDAARMHRQLAHITAKQRICTAAIKKLLETANNGVYPTPRTWPEFPELSHKDEA